MEEKVSTELKHSELQQELVRRSINEVQEKASSVLLFCLHWKEVENHFDSMRGLIEAEKEEVVRKEREVNEREREVGLKEKRVEGLFKEFRLKDEDFKEWRTELELKELELGAKVRERYDEVELKEKKVEGEFRELALREKRVEKRFAEVEMTKRNVEELAKEVRAKDEEFRKQRKGVELKEKEIEERFKEIELMERKAEERVKEIGLMEMKVGEKSEEIELNKRKLEEGFRELESKCRKVEERIKGLELKEKELEERSREFDLKEKRIEEVELKEKKLEERLREVELENKKSIERIMEFELKEKQFVDACNARVKSEPVDYSMDANLNFSVKMDGKALQIFLNERSRRDDKIKDEVFIALGHSSDPAKLVLDAMEGFYPPHLRKGDMEFKEVVVQRSCNLLLEQLMKISPPIKPHVRKEAMRLAFIWMTKMRLDDKHYLEVLGFFYLLATYGLGHAFDSDELISRLVMIARNRQTPEFLRVLGLADKIPRFIQNLISKNQPTEALRFIYAFEMVNQFPPGPLLRDYINASKIAARKIRSSSKSLATQVEAANKRVADLMVVLKCVEDYKLQSEFSPDTLKQQIKDVEKNLNWKTKLPNLGCKSKPLNPSEKKHMALKVASSAPVLASKNVSDCKTALKSTTAASAATSAAPITVTTPSLTAACIASPVTVTSYAPIVSPASPVAPIAVTSPSKNASPIALKPASAATSADRITVTTSSPTAASIASPVTVTSHSPVASTASLVAPIAVTSPSTTAGPVVVTAPNSNIASTAASTSPSTVAFPSSTSASPSASIPKNEPQYQSGNKRCEPQFQRCKCPQENYQGVGKRHRVATSSEAPLGASSLQNTSIPHSAPLPHQNTNFPHTAPLPHQNTSFPHSARLRHQNTRFPHSVPLSQQEEEGSFMNQGEQYMNTSAGPYNFAGYPPLNPQMSSYCNNGHPDYHWNTF